MQITKIVTFVRPFVFQLSRSKIDVWSSIPQMDFKTVIGFVVRDFFEKYAGRAKYPTHPLDNRGPKVMGS